MLSLPIVGAFASPPLGRTRTDVLSRTSPCDGRARRFFRVREAVAFPRRGTFRGLAMPRSALPWHGTGHATLSSLAMHQHQGTLISLALRRRPLARAASSSPRVHADNLVALILAFLAATEQRQVVDTDVIRSRTFTARVEDRCIMPIAAKAPPRCRSSAVASFGVDRVLPVGDVFLDQPAPLP